MKGRRFSPWPHQCRCHRNTDEWGDLRRQRVSKRVLSLSFFLSFSLLLSPLPSFSELSLQYTFSSIVTWNGGHFPNEWVDEAGAHRCPDIADRESKASGHTHKFGVMRQTQMRLRNANGKMTKALRETEKRRREEKRREEKRRERREEK